MDLEENKKKEDLIDEEVADISTISDEPLEISEEAKKSEEELEKIAPVDSNQVLKTKSPSKKILIAILFIAINLLAILVTVVIVLILLLSFKTVNILRTKSKKS